jgi:predicted Fe-Mo cluster-binding NifX family protein
VKICIPSESGGGKSSPLSGHFGSAPFFTIYDPDTSEFDVISNHNEHHQHGQCHPLSIMGKQNIDVIICRGMGRRAVQALDNAGIKVYISNAVTVDQCLREFNKNKLVVMDLDGACRGHGCH